MKAGRATSDRKQIEQLPFDNAARVRLRRNRMLAQGLLVLMGGTFLATHLVEDPGFLTGLVRAGAEAGLVGGIADWFAVTALFRHPLGLPIPHTAIVPNNQERIGRTLGRFVERHFLTQEVLTRKIEEGRFGRVLAEWLASPRTGERIAGPAAAALAGILRSLGNRDLQELADRTLGRQLRKANVAPPLGRALRLLTQSGEADVLFENAIDVGIAWLGENRQRINQIVAGHSRWWIPKAIDRRVSDAIVREVTDILLALRARDSDARLQFREALTELIDTLADDPERQAAINDAKNRFLQHPELQAWMGSVWQELSERSLAELDRPDSRTRAALARGIAMVGEALKTDPKMQVQIDVLLRRLAKVVVSWRGEIGSFISDVVRSWDISTLTDRLEVTVGSDLQYIRMNGTVVGACVGCIIFLLSWLLLPEGAPAG
jgi:uncharacterized membrane-anchored protein YjiN (DUF445 family)